MPKRNGKKNSKKISVKKISVQHYPPLEGHDKGRKKPCWISKKLFGISVSLNNEQEINLAKCVIWDLARLVPKLKILCKNSLFYINWRVHLTTVGPVKHY